tara:strand:+ start:1834 stop:2586 length:753 start_codon:yes stop_codon:yes gene_type:complete
VNKNPIITVKELYKSYRKKDKNALNGISLEIESGEVFGLLGPNGAGKTTFFSILCGLLLPTSGEVIVNQLSLSQSMQQVKKIIGVVPQEIALYPTLSGKENLLFIGRMYGLSGKTLHNRVDELLTTFGFDENRNAAVKSYSGGMKRKINLIGGILHRPKILLLDEPTVGIDVHSRIAIMQFLKTFNREHETTIIYTSHHLEQAEQFCDQVAIINDGIVLTQDTPQALKQTHQCKNLEEVFISLTGKKITA